MRKQIITLTLCLVIHGGRGKETATDTGNVDSLTGTATDTDIAPVL